MSQTEIVKLDKRRKHPIDLVWCEYEKNRKIAGLYDNKLHYITDVSRYLLFKANEHITKHGLKEAAYTGYKSSVHSCCYNMKSFFQFLANIELDWRQVTDEHIKQFRDQKINQINKSETTNFKLEVIYEFYWFCQEELNLFHNKIGQKKLGVDIVSRLADRKNGLIKSGRRLKGGGTDIYPLKLPVQSRQHGSTQHFSSEIEERRLREYWRKNSNHWVAARNSMILETAEFMLWRQGELQSLKTTDFTDKLIAEAKNDKYYIQPSLQKFSYTNTFPMPLALAIKINKYIKEERKELLDAKNIDEKVARHHLFLNKNSGKPLARKAGISKIMSDGFKAIGVLNKRVGAHSIRRGGGVREATKIIQRYKDIGVIPTPRQVIHELCCKLGHSSESALPFYTMGMDAIYGSMEQNKDNYKLKYLECLSENMQLHRKLAQAEQTLRESESLKKTKESE